MKISDWTRPGAVSCLSIFFSCSAVGCSFIEENGGGNFSNVTSCFFCLGEGILVNEDQCHDSNVIFIDDLLQSLDSTSH